MLKSKKAIGVGLKIGSVVFLTIIILGVVATVILPRHKKPATTTSVNGKIAQSKTVTPGLPPNSVAVVGGEPISVTEFDTIVRIQNVQILEQYYRMVQIVGDDPSIRKTYQDALDNLAKNVQEYLIEGRLFRQEAARRGITVSQQEIEKFMQELRGYYSDGTPTPMSQSPGGSSNGASASTVTPTLPASPFLTSTPFTLQAYTEIYQKFLQYYAQYQVSESDLTHMVESQLIHNKVQATVLADANAIPEQQEFIWARQIQVRSEKTAKEIIKKLNQGTDFAELVKQYSEDPSTKDKGGDLGWFSRAEADAAFAKAAFALQNVNDITQQPVKTSLGYHIIQLLGRENRPFASDQDKFNYWVNVQKQTVQITMATVDSLKALMPTMYPLPTAMIQATETPTQ